MITSRELESRLRESAALYDREVQPVRDLDRRIMARAAITPRGESRRRSLQRELVWSTLLAVAVLGLAIAVVVGIRSGILRQPNPAPVKHSPTPSLPPAPGAAVFVSNTFFLSSQVGWIESDASTGHTPTIYKTTDGGQHWQAQLQFVGGNALQQMLFQGNDGVLVGYDGNPLYRTTDGGAHWQRISLPQILPGEGGGAEPVWFNNPYEGWLYGLCAGCSYGAIFHTLDGGVHWTRIGMLNPTNAFSGHLRLSFRDELNGWVVSDVNPQMYVTHDGGKNWTPVPLQLPAIPSNAQAGIVVLPRFFNNQQGLLVLRSAVQSTVYCLTADCKQRAGPGLLPPKLYLYTPSDGGNHWSAPDELPAIGSVGFNEFYGFGDVFFLDADHFWMVAGQTVATSMDGGLHWTIHAHAVLPTVSLSRPDFLSAAQGWVVGTAQANAQAVPETALYRTADGGIHWLLVTTPGS